MAPTSPSSGRSQAHGISLGLAPSGTRLRTSPSLNRPSNLLYVDGFQGPPAGYARPVIHVGQLVPLLEVAQGDVEVAHLGVQQPQRTEEHRPVADVVAHQVQGEGAEASAWAMAASASS